MNSLFVIIIEEKKGIGMETKFYNKVWFAILMTVLLYPLGMFLVWRNKVMKKEAKIVATVLGAIFFLVVLSSDSTPPEITLDGESNLSVYKDEVMSEQEIIDIAVSGISDNTSEMSTSDIIIDGYKDIDFTTVGEYEISFVASDEAENEVVVPYTINVQLTEEEAEAKEAEQEAKEAEQEAKENENRENEKALSSAENYIKLMAFSEEGLRDQLEFEGFTSTQIDYAIDNLDVDWNEEAVESATSYSNTLDMSSSAIYDQLIFEGFSEEQAQYGIDNY